MTLLKDIIKEIIEGFFVKEQNERIIFHSPILIVGIPSKQRILFHFSTLIIASFTKEIKIPFLAPRNSLAASLLEFSLL